MGTSQNFSRPARIAAIAPYLWMAIFFLVPFLFILKISLSQTAIAQPPYEPVFDITQHIIESNKCFIRSIVWTKIFMHISISKPLGAHVIEMIRG